MKNLLVILLALLALAGSSEAKIKGGAPVSDKGTQVWVNVSGLEQGSAVPGTVGQDFFLPTVQELCYLHSKGVAAIRLPVKWERLQPNLGTDPTLSSTYVGYITTTISNAASCGLKVMPDVHNFGGYYHGSINGQVGAVGGPSIAQFGDLWGRLSATYPNNPNIFGFDLMNEPNTMPNANIVPQMYQAAVTAIRVNDNQTRAYLEGDGYASAFAWNGDCARCGGAPIGGWNPGGNADLLTVNDPALPLVFSAHDYADSDSSGSYPTYPAAPGCPNGGNSFVCAQTEGNVLTTPTSPLTTDILVQRDTPFVINFCNTPAAKNKGTCNLGETGWPTDSNQWNIAGDKHIAFLQENNVSFIYWNTQPDNPSYPLSIEPFSYTAPIQDKVQVAVLTKYTGAAQPTAYFITGPSRGSSGVASSNFTLSYSGYITQSLTITLSDSGAGGSFTPSTITCSPGFNCTGTFTYTAPGSAVYVITGTNTVGLTNPTLGYATISDFFTQNPGTYKNAIFMCKVYAPYIGPAVNLRRGSDNATQDFYFKTTALNSCIDTDAILAWNGTSEVDTLVSTSIIVGGTALFASDGGVKYTGSGIPLTKIDPSIFMPSAGQYSVTGAGHYRFSSSDIGAKVTISYLRPTYTVTAYDQLSLGNMTTITADGGQNPSLADQPPFQLECTQNHIPCMNFIGSNRMDAISPLATGAQSVFVVFNPVSHNGSNLISWTWSGVFTDTFWGGAPTTGSDGDQWYVTGTPFNNGSRLYSQDNQWATISGSLTVGGSTSGMRGFTNGILTTQSPSTSTSLALPFGRNNLTVGYQRFSPASGFIAQLGGILTAQNALTDTAQTNLHNTIDTLFGIPSLTSYPWYAPTLQQNIGSANAPPWAGFNSLGAVGSNGQNSDFRIPPEGQQYFANLGFNIERVNIKWEQLQQNLCTGNTTLDPTWLANMDSYVASIEAKGIDPELDLHNGGVYSYSYWSSCASPPDDGKITSATTQTYFVNFWTQIAAHYATDPKVKFGLMNEPAGFSAASLETPYQLAINGIRASSNNYIFAGFGPSFSACSDVPANAGPAFKTLTDGGQNHLDLECHNYFQPGNNDLAGEYAVQGAALTDLNGGNPIGTPGGATGYCLTNSCHMVWFEFNEAFTASMETEVNIAFTLLSTYPTVWDGWAEFRADPSGKETYPGNILPRDFTQPYSNRPLVIPMNAYATGHTCALNPGAAWPYTYKFPCGVP